MRQDELSPAPGSRRGRKRVGRGDGSGHGTYSGRGCKGQKCRSGYRSTININRLNIFAPGSEVTPEKLVAAGVIKSLRHPIKILAQGDINHPLLVKANKFSVAAKAKIEGAGGKVEEVGYGTKAS